MKTVGYSKKFDFYKRKIVEKMCKDYLDEMIAEVLGKTHQNISSELRRVNREDYTAKKAQKDYWKNEMNIYNSYANAKDRHYKACVKQCLASDPDVHPEEIAKLFDLDIERVKRIYKRKEEKMKQEEKE